LMASDDFYCDSLRRVGIPNRLVNSGMLKTRARALVRYIWLADNKATDSDTEFRWSEVPVPALIITPGTTLRDRRCGAVRCGATSWQALRYYVPVGRIGRAVVGVWIVLRVGVMQVVVPVMWMLLQPARRGR
jgi:hypothetical protein